FMMLPPTPARAQEAAGRGSSGIFGSLNVTSPRPEGPPLSQILTGFSEAHTRSSSATRRNAASNDEATPFGLTAIIRFSASPKLSISQQSGSRPPVPAVRSSSSLGSSDHRNTGNPLAS